MLLQEEVYSIYRKQSSIKTRFWKKVKDWSRWEEKFIHGPYIHHVIGVHDKIAPVLYEAVKYIKGLELDTIDPDIESIKDWLSCRC